MLYRKLLMDQVEVVKAGNDPLGTIRDPEKNTIILLQNEDGPVATPSIPWTTTQIATDPIIFNEAKALLERHKTVEVHDLVTSTSHPFSMVGMINLAFE